MAEALLVRHGFSVTFGRQASVRRRVNEIEDSLRTSFPDGYVQPQLIPISDELDATIPRLIFASSKGFNQIMVSQVSATLNVEYSPDWQRDSTRCLEYFRRRVEAIFAFLPAISPDVEAQFCGVTTVIRIPTPGGSQDAVRRVAAFLSPDVRVDDVNEVTVRLSRNVDNSYFDNVVVQSYRDWSDSVDLDHLPQRVPFSKTVDAGIEVVSDYNDRLGYNEQSSYSTSQAVGLRLVEAGFNAAQRTVGKVTSSGGS